MLVAFLLSPVQPLADKVGDNPSYDRRKEFKNSIHDVYLLSVPCWEVATVRLYGEKYNERTASAKVETSLKNQLIW